MKMVTKDRKMRRSRITTGTETVIVVRRSGTVKVVMKTGLWWTGVFPYTAVSVSQGFSWEISKVRDCY